jgi:hypothetical protein
MTTNFSQPIPNSDYYINDDGLLVFTENYHLKRGYCCKSGCLHCPFDYQNTANPDIPAEYSDSWGEEE